MKGMWSVYFWTLINLYGLLNLTTAQKLPPNQITKEESLDYNLSENASNCMSISIAIKTGHNDQVIACIKNGTPINIADENGFSPLHVAAANQNEEIARILIENGARINALDNEGSTPLHSAMNQAKKHFSLTIGIADLLLKHGSNINAVDFKGNTPLCLASKRTSMEVVQFMLNQKGSNRESVLCALKVAFVLENLKMLDLLFQFYVGELKNDLKDLNEAHYFLSQTQSINETDLLTIELMNEALKAELAELINDHITVLETKNEQTILVKSVQIGSFDSRVDVLELNEDLVKSGFSSLSVLLTCVILVVLVLLVLTLLIYRRITLKLRSIYV